jgi:hypothetical protein
MKPGRKSLGDSIRRQVRLPIQLNERLEERARAETCDVSDLIRRAIIQVYFLPLDVDSINKAS